MRLAIARFAPPPRDHPVPELIGESQAMLAVRQAIVRAAASPFPVVIEGESGSGKELAARAIHPRSARRDRRFCAINCAALVDELVEAEMFGHARGAFTSANTDRPGLFEDASGGTLFMDEVAELGARVQAKLLRVLQEGEVRRVGETHVRKVDVRVVAATNRPLCGEVSAGRFRADLWYRLDVVRITLPPLRERVEDIPRLAQHLWGALAQKTGSRAGPAASTLAALAAYDWPGNVRELRNAIERAMILEESSTLTLASLPAATLAEKKSPAALTLAQVLEAGISLEENERMLLRSALEKTGGNQTQAAHILGITRDTLRYRMKKFSLN